MKPWNMLIDKKYLHPELSEMSGKSHEPEEELHRKLEAIRYEI